MKATNWVILLIGTVQSMVVLELVVCDINH